jgi:hypothetical protein
MRKWLADKENLILIAIVAIAWILAATLYSLSQSSALDLSKQAGQLTGEINKIIKTEAEKDVRLTHLALNTLIQAHKTTFWAGLAHHAALALFVAGLLILVVDIHTRHAARKGAEKSREDTRKDIETYRNSIAEDVWKAVSGRLVPDDICREIDTILKGDVVKEDNDYTITIAVPYEGLAAGTLVVRREVSYLARNLTGTEGAIYPMRSSISSSLPDRPVRKDGQDISLPRHIRCAIDGLEIPAAQYLDPKDQRVLRYDVELPKDGGRRIYLVWDEICKDADTNFYTTTLSSKDLTVRVINMAADRIRLRRNEVRLLHPRAGDFVMTQEDLWEFKGGILPGQSFAVSWEPR